MSNPIMVPMSRPPPISSTEDLLQEVLIVQGTRRARVGDDFFPKLGTILRTDRGPSSREAEGDVRMQSGVDSHVLVYVPWPREILGREKERDRANFVRRRITHARSRTQRVYLEVMQALLTRLNGHHELRTCMSR
jgi:hypothetical protein